MKETPGMGCTGATTKSSSFSKDGNSSLTMVQASAEFIDQVSSCPLSPTNVSKAVRKSQCLAEVTPKKDFTENTCNLMPEAESTLNLSVNSHTQKKSKCMVWPLIDLVEEKSDSPSAQTPGCVSFIRNTVANKDANRKIEFDFPTNPSECQSTKSRASQFLPVGNCAPSYISSDPAMDQKLLISCSRCNSPLGLSENQLYVRCSLTSSSKVYLMSLVNGGLEPCSENASTCIPVLMTDIESVDQRLCNNTIKDKPGRGVWCEEDGCVFHSLFCPFCNTSNCLGVQIMATDASNVQLLNKVHFNGILYLMFLQIKRSFIFIFFNWSCFVNFFVLPILLITA